MKGNKEIKNTTDVSIQRQDIFAILIQHQINITNSIPSLGRVEGEGMVMQPYPAITERYFQLTLNPICNDLLLAQ